MRRFMQAAAAMLLLITGLLAGCSGAKQPEQPVQGYTQEEIEAVTIAAPGIAAVEGAGVSQRVHDFIARRFGLDIRPWNVPEGQTMEQALSQAAEQDALPDVFVHAAFDRGLEFQLWAERGLIRRMPRALWGKYEALARVLSHYESFETMPNGGLYHVPITNDAFSQTDGQDDIIYYRRDWAGQLGYDVLVEESYSWQSFSNMLYDMAKKDPDKNESRDTYGLTAYSGEMLYDIMFSTFGVRDWVLENGEWVPGFASERAVTAVGWLNQYYREGIIDPDFDTQTMEEAMRKFALGQVGAIVLPGDADTALRLEREFWEPLNPGTDINNSVSVMAQPISSYGVSYNELEGYESALLFSSNVDDQLLDRLYAMLDWMYSEEGQTYLQYGEEGVDFTWSEGAARTLLQDEQGNAITFQQANDRLFGLTTLATRNHEGIPADGLDAFTANSRQIIENTWWVNNWRRPMFTRYLDTPYLRIFRPEDTIYDDIRTVMMESVDVSADWEQCVQKYRDATMMIKAMDEVNGYARETGFNSEE